MLGVMNAVTQAVQGKFNVLGPLLDERTRRLWAAAEARAIGRGGITRVAEATGLSRGTVRAGVRELDSSTPPAPRAGGARIRAPGGGRKTVAERDPGLVKALEHLLDPFTRGDPQGPLRWTCSSAARLAEQLGAEGHRASERTVNRLLHELGYSLQANRKTLEGREHPDRDVQFRRIARRVRAFQRLGQPVASIDTKKKELVGRYRNGGREWRPKGQPEEVKVHDFIDRELGKAIPYGVYDLTANTGWVSVGVDHDTAEFAVETVRRWWLQMGRQAYPSATRLLLTADGGGSNSSRSRLWKFELQKAGRRAWVADLGVPLSAGDQQVEQDRAPDVLPHHGELAGPAAGESRGGGEPDRRYDYAGRFGHPVGVGRGRLPNRSGGHGRPDGQAVHQTRRVSW